MLCKKCGAELAIDDSFCSECGAKTQQGDDLPPVSEQQIVQPKKRGRTALLVLSVALILSLALNITQAFFPGKVSLDDTHNESTEIKQNQYNEIVEEAITALSQKWEELFSEDNRTNGYLAIYNTRVIDIEPDENDIVFQEIEGAMEIDYIVEFSLFSDYFSSAPYYHNAAIYDTVIVYEDGTTAVANNFFRVYSNLSYNYDYSEFVDEIANLGSAYNRVISSSKVEEKEDPADDGLYGFTTYQISTYQTLRLYDLLEANNLTEYEPDHLIRRSYKYTADDYKKIAKLDESYLYAFYTQTTLETLTEVCQALGYDDIENFLISKGYVDKDGNPDVSVWYKHNKKEIAAIMKETLDN